MAAAESGASQVTDRILIHAPRPGAYRRSIRTAALETQAPAPQAEDQVGRIPQRPDPAFRRQWSFGSLLLQHTLANAVSYLIVVVPLMLAEQLFPTSRPSLRSYWIGFVGWILGWALGYGVVLASRFISVTLGISPLLVIKVSSYASIAAALLAFANIFVFDFFYYWFHRMQHNVPWLWRLHAVHHSIRELNSVMSFHHPVEELLRIIPIILPLALLVRFDDVPVIPLVSGFVGAWGQFIHTDTRLNLGPVRLLIGDGHYHRIHHSCAMSTGIGILQPSFRSGIGYSALSTFRSLWNIRRSVSRCAREA